MFSTRARALARLTARAVAPVRRRPFATEDGSRTMRPMPEGTKPIVEEAMPRQEDEDVRRRRALALRTWLESELGGERTALMTVLAKHRVQIPGGGDEANALVNELLEWKAQGVLEGGGAGEER